MKRVLVGSMLHETNTFNPMLTDLEEFRIRGLLFGDEILEKRRNTGTEMGGFIETLEEKNIEIVPSAHACPLPAGLVTTEALDTVLGAFIDTLDRTQVDGVLLAIHGAMVTQEQDDGEGYILKTIREKVGQDIPIIHTLDFHATLTPMMAENADAMTIYRTYPHMDMAERGREAAAMMARTLNGEINPVVVIVKRPLLIGPPHNVLPHDMPMKRIMDRAREMEAEIPGVIAACPAQGFMQQDVPYNGIGVAVTTDNNPELAKKCADELADMIFDKRKEFYVELPDPAETIRLALKSDNPPVAIADSGDNIGGGTPGDGTALLHEILRQGVDTAYVPICDPESARLAAEAGVGSTVTLEVGGKSHSLYGPPVKITGKVRTITDGLFLNRSWGGYWGGVIGNMGLSARIDVDRVTIVVTSYRISPDNIMHAKSIGVYPEDYRMSVCKGGLAFREAYKTPVVNSYIQSDTPGFASSNLKNFTFTKIKRPIYPLDDI
ncbi:MAG: M81 family metallopeptidase [Candidatus Latescibacteria bacterium]|jgi:microcystin degradation protein MlrC|nr:M81 family metallopeptidase [Candidatus Latescibacterota bacterium]